MVWMPAMRSLRKPPGPRQTRRETLAARYAVFIHDLFDDYQPERHYMRGPGPKWREKHPDAAAPMASGRPAHSDTAPLYPDGIRA
jgi:hypothetical protein